MSVITAESRTDAEIIQQPRGKARFWEREAPLAYLFMIPGLIILLLFMAYPFFLGIYLSMTDKMVGFADLTLSGLTISNCCSGTRSFTAPSLTR